MEFNKEYPENQKKHGVSGNIKTHDHFAERLQTGWTPEMIRARIALDWRDPAPWTIFDKHPIDDQPYGPGKKYATYDEWIETLV